MASVTGHPDALLEALAPAQQPDLIAVDVGLRIRLNTGMAGRAQRYLPVAIEPRRVSDLRMLFRHAVALLARDPLEQLAGAGLCAVASQTLRRDGPVQVDLSILVAATGNSVARRRAVRDRPLVQ